MRNWTGSRLKYLSKLVLLKGCITIFETARTGKVGDGKILTLGVEKVIRV